MGGWRSPKTRGRTSGSLVHDLILEEFATLVRIKYMALQKKVGMAAKGVSIVGQCLPLKIFLEDITQPIIIELFVVK